MLIARQFFKIEEYYTKFQLSMQFQRTWFDAEKILPEHQRYPVTQVYCWLWTKDKKIALVSKDNKNWQFPGGHPKDKETIFQTVKRELQEEISLDIREDQQPTLFGYYLIEEREKSKIKRKYLQLRVFLFLDSDSKELKIKPNETQEEKEEDKVCCARWVSLSQAKKLIPWLGDSGELSSFSNLING